MGDPALPGPITNWHGLAANVLLGLALLYAAAALLHYYVFRDGVLRRMIPRSS
jgi:cytochrome b561